MAKLKELPPLMRARDVLTVFPVSPSYWEKKVALGVFPQPVKMGKISFWKAEDISALIDKIKGVANENGNE